MANELRRECAKCGGKGTQRGALGMAFKTVCETCNGRGYVTLSNVVVAPIVTQHNSDADVVLRQAIGALAQVVVVGHTVDGHEFFASNMASGPDALWLLERGRHNLLNTIDKEPDE